MNKDKLVFIYHQFFILLLFVRFAASGNELLLKRLKR